MKTAWVTGASSGIGRELALRLSRSGARVYISSRGVERLVQTAKEESGPGELIPLAADVTDSERMSEAAALIEREQGGIDLAVFNAGDYRPMPADELDAGECRRLMEVNYLGVVNGVAAVLPAMLARGSGQIVINASVAGYRGLPLAGAYGATKAALISLAESLRIELEGQGVDIKVVNPGFVKTPLTAQNPFKMPSLVTPEEAAESIHRGIGRDGFEITFPKRFTYFLKVLRSLPYGLYFPLIRRMTGIGR